MSHEFKKYMNPYKPGWMVLTVLAGGLFLAVLISMILRSEFSPVPLILLPVLVLISLIPFFRAKKFFAALEKDPSLSSLEGEFAAAKSMRKDSVRFGENLIFIKGSGALLRYSDIKRVYQYIYRVNLIEKERTLKYADGKGKDKKLCPLETGGASDGEVAEMTALILSKNPLVELGHR